MKGQEDKRIGLYALAILWEQCECLNVCLCLGCGVVGGVAGQWKGGLVHDLEGWGGVWIYCVDGRSRNLYIVLDGYLRILGALRVQSCCTLSAS